LDSPQVNHGEIWLDHQPLHTMKSHEAARAGIGLVPEDRCIIPGLTVEENLQLAQIVRRSAGRSSGSTNCSRALESAGSRRA
jgi:ABC-type branched-subunit amino acid transport system ATPase component